MRKLPTFAVGVLAMTIALPSAWARDHDRDHEAHEGAAKADHDKDRDKGERDKGDHDKDDKGREDWHRDGGRHDEDSDDDDDRGEAPAPLSNLNRTQPQAEFHDKLVAVERRRLGEYALRVHRKLTFGERRAMGVHWRHVMRLERIRELAETAKDTATIAKVDALLAREEKRVTDRLAETETAEGGAR